MTGDEKHEWAYYAALAGAYRGVGVLESWTEFGSPLGQHPDRTLVPGVEIGSGSLGHGIALGVGTALGLPAW